MYKLIKASLITLLLLIFLHIAAYAQSPALLNYQGKLTNKDGSPASGTKSMTFSIYDVEEGGTALWKEEERAVTVSNGVFNVLLGEVEDLADSLFARGVLYLGIKVDNDEEMKPRFRLTSVPYAVQSKIPKIEMGSFQFDRYKYPQLENLQLAEDDGSRRASTEISVKNIDIITAVYTSLSGIDSDANINLRIGTGADEIQKNKFRLELGTWADTRIYSATVSWIAIGY